MVDLSILSKCLFLTVKIRAPTTAVFRGKLYFCLGDGFGVGWYPPTGKSSDMVDSDDPSPCLFTSLQPAWNSENLSRLAKKIVSPLFFAHVRAAGAGKAVPSLCSSLSRFNVFHYPGMPVNDASCHPLQCGRYLFMHNGGIGGFTKVLRKLMARLDQFAYDWLMQRVKPRTLTTPLNYTLWHSFVIATSI